MKRERTPISLGGLVLIVSVIAGVTLNGVLPLLRAARTVDDWAEGGLFLGMAALLTWYVVTRLRTAR